MKARYHAKDGTPLPGCTDIAGMISSQQSIDSLIGWGGMCAARTGDAQQWRRDRQEAADIGTHAHTLIYHALETNQGGAAPSQPAHITARAHAACYNAIEWIRAIGAISPILIEREMLSVCGFGGKPDLVASLNGDGDWVIDWKTGSKVGTKEFLQMAGYKILCEEHGVSVKGAKIVRLGKKVEGGEIVRDAQCYTMTLPQLARYEEIFLRLLECYQTLVEIADAKQKPRSKSLKGYDQDAKRAAK